MPTVTSWERRMVLDAANKDVGTVEAVLFHASEPRVVGIEVDQGAILAVVDRPARFVLLSSLREEGEAALALDTRGLPKDEVGERALQMSWQDTVIWHHMPVRSEDGEGVGTVHDALFDPTTGVVARLSISTGAVGDAAVGRLEVSGELVRGFDGEAVVVLPGYNQIEAGGGAAKAVASGVAAVKVRGEMVGEGALQVGVAAAEALGRSLKHGTARKALDKLKSLMGEDE